MPRRRSVHRLARSLGLLAAVCSFLLVGVTPTATASPKQSVANSFGSDMFGVSVGGDLQSQDPATLGRDLDAIQRVGSRWLRIDINWAQIQAGGPSSYEWDAIDRVVEGAAARGIKTLGVIGYTPEWARPSGTGATYGPAPAKYAAFAARAVEHYAAMGIHAYEVWNEPNIDGFWTPAPDVSDYTQLLKAAYPAIKGADPQATVLTGGTAPAPSNGTNHSPVDFLRGIYANGGGDSFDAVAHHPYCWPASPGDPESWSAWHLMNRPGTSLRSLMSASGDGDKKIWATEFGAPTDGPSESSVSEKAQAEMITEAYSLWKTYEWAGPLFTYEGRDLGTRTDTRENFFGMLRHDFSRKPSYEAYRAAASGGGATRVKVKIKARKKGRGNVKGNVSTQGTPAAAGGLVELTLYRKFRSGWKPTSAALNTVLNASGRFRTRLGAFQKRRLRPGTYRAGAHYVGSTSASPAASRSRKVKLRRS
jgi:hypothetical protein